ncbi:MAG: hypothetical protein WA012_10435 [Rhodoferax sp.]|uniref:hypothetical protein n=1 Tax=Rhodoferax sp. TaxID=50421 RepID=UPI003BB008C5
MTKFKKHNPLPDSDYVMRQVPYKLLERDADTDQVLGFLPGAFSHRPGEEYLSFNWLEYFGGTHLTNASQCKAAIQTVRKDKKALHGVAQVGRTKTLAQHSAKPVRLVYYPNDKNQSHSALFMDQSAPESACEDLAREFFKQHY